MLKNLENNIEDKQPNINISMLGVYDYHFSQSPGGKCIDCWMFSSEPDYCTFYRRLVPEPYYDSDCKVRSIVVKEKR
jgi:hypothetical protein